MNLIGAIVLAIVEGVTEFLPVSSTGHLILVSKLLSIPSTSFAKSFDIIIQAGAILAVVTLYGKMLFAKPKMMIPVLAAFLPTAIIGLLLYHFIKDYLLDNQMIIITALAVGGLVLILVERKVASPKYTALAAMPILHAVLIGLGQSLSIIPGISRSGATIVTALLLGWSRERAVEFSFLLAIPTVAAAAGLDTIKNFQTIETNIPILLVGLLISWISALIAVKSFVGFIKNHRLMAFGVYRIFIAAFFALFLRSS